MISISAMSMFLILMYFAILIAELQRSVMVMTPCDVLWCFCYIVLVLSLQRSVSGCCWLLLPCFARHHALITCCMPGTVLGAFHFPGGSVVKDLPTNAGDAGSLAGLKKMP